MPFAWIFRFGLATLALGVVAVSCGSAWAKASAVEVDFPLVVGNYSKFDRAIRIANRAKNGVKIFYAARPEESKGVCEFERDANINAFSPDFMGDAFQADIAPGEIFYHEFALFGLLAPCAVAVSIADMRGKITLQESATLGPRTLPQGAPVDLNAGDLLIDTALSRDRRTGRVIATLLVKNSSRSLGAIKLTRFRLLHCSSATLVKGSLGLEPGLSQILIGPGQTWPVTAVVAPAGLSQSLNLTGCRIDLAIANSGSGIELLAQSVPLATKNSHRKP